MGDPIMRELRSMLEQLGSEKGIEWEAQGADVVVNMVTGRRRQRVRVSREDNQFVFSTLVLGSAASHRKPDRRRRLAMHAWTRNATTELVNFTFDQSGRLVGEIRHLADHLDVEELAIYLSILATEGDRFEYVLTGRDKH